MIDFDALMNRDFPTLNQHYTERDTMLYALSIGVGFDPLDPRPLPFVCDDGLQAFPTMAAVLCHPWMWIRESDIGLDWERCLHVGQGLELRHPLPTSGRVRAKTRVQKIVDKGPDRGALIYTERATVDVETGADLCRVTQTTYARGDGGFGGPEVPVETPHPIPARDPDLVCDLPTMPQQALIYRLNGDTNPHNVIPAAAAASGFDRPILQGLCTYGVAAHAIVRACCDYDATKLCAINARLSAPVYPGETLRTEIWRRTGNKSVAFRTRAVERGRIVLDNGQAEFRNSTETPY